MTKILRKLLVRGLIELSESKYPEEIGRTNDPKYCKCYMIISHPMQKCKAFKEKVMELVKEGRIILDEETMKNPINLLSIPY